MVIYIVTELHESNDCAPYVYTTPFQKKEDAQEHMAEKFEEYKQSLIDDAELEEDEFTAQIYEDSASVSDEYGDFVCWDIKEEELN